jgi:mono/diheme cytochrome c family protein
MESNRIFVACVLLTLSHLAFAQETTDQGKKLYQEFCASCHGINLDGRGPLARAVVPAPPDLKQHVKEHPGMMDNMHPIMHGDGPMPAWRDVISHEEAFSIVKYLLATTESK